MTRSTTAGLIFGCLLAACGSVSPSGVDAAPGPDGGAGSVDAPPGPPDAAWPAQATVAVVGPDTINGDCPNGSFAVTLTGPANTPLTLVMTLSDADMVATNLGGAVTLDGSGALTLATVITAATGPSMTLTIEAGDAYGRVSTGEAIVAVTGGGGPVCAR